MMGKNKSGFDTSRNEFTPEINIDSGGLEYPRTGGCFVTTKRAIALAFLAIIALAAVGSFMYFYRTKANTLEEESPLDLENLINNSIINADKQMRLPTIITPFYYRLKIHPYLDELHNKNFTFSGRVSISVSVSKSTSHIVLNSEFLDIKDGDIEVLTTKSLTLRQTFPNDVPQTMPPPVINIAKPTIKGMGEAFPPVKSNAAQKNISAQNMPNVDELPIRRQFQPQIVTNSSLPHLPQELQFPVINIANVPSNDEKLQAESDANQPRIPQSVATNSSLSNSATFLNQSSLPRLLPTVDDNSVIYSIPPPPQQNRHPTIQKVIKMSIQSFEMDPKNGLLTINMRKKLEPKVNYTIDIKFSGKIQNNLVGLYKTSYVGDDKKKRWLLSTHLQPIFARRVFPCFDEPSFKSVFEISIARRTNMTSLSNMPKKESESLPSESGWVWDHFEPSHLMPSYLVAFTVFDFKKLQPSSTTLGPVFNIWAPQEKLKEAKYAIEITPKIFEYLQNYFGVNYPLSKIDLVALPELPQRATDNWGIILFRDSSLLMNYQIDSWKVKNNIFKTIVRKLTTQWFGNLVTMNWWTEMWLIDGFSTFMEDVVENAVDPELGNLDSFPSRITQSILDADQLTSVRSLNGELKELNQIEQLFDDAAINKGSCLLRMLNYTLSEPVFKQGVQNYLKKWAFKCSDEDSFWDSFEEVSKGKKILPENLTIKTFMNSWIKQEGYPVITVTRNYTTGNAKINQTRFVQSDSTYDSLWYIPLTFTRKTDNEAVSMRWLEATKSIDVLNLSPAGSDSWVIFNIDQAGFYRVNYDEENWHLLQKQLFENHTKILSPNRGQLLNDAFELAYAGLLDYRIAFELTKYLKKERNYQPWHSVYSSLRSIEQILADTAYNGIFQDYIIKLIHPIYVKMNSEQTQLERGKLLKNFMLEVACSMKYQPCLDWAMEQFKSWRDSPAPDADNVIPFDVRKTVQCAVIKAGGQKEWMFLWYRTRYPFMSSANKRIAYASLGCTQEPWLITSYLEKTLNGSIGIQYIPEVWKSITHPVGLKTGFAFLRTNWERIYSQYHDNNPIITAIFDDFLSKLSTSVDLEDLTSFYKGHSENLYPVSTLMLNVVEKIKRRVYWSKTHLKTISAWLLSN